MKRLHGLRDLADLRGPMEILLPRETDAPATGPAAGSAEEMPTSCPWWGSPRGALPFPIARACSTSSPTATCWPRSRPRWTCLRRTSSLEQPRPERAVAGQDGPAAVPGLTSIARASPWWTLRRCGPSRSARRNFMRWKSPPGARPASCMWPGRAIPCPRSRAATVLGRPTWRGSTACPGAELADGQRIVVYAPSSGRVARAPRTDFPPKRRGPNVPTRCAGGQASQGRRGRGGPSRWPRLLPSRSRPARASGAEALSRADPQGEGSDSGPRGSVFIVAPAEAGLRLDAFLVQRAVASSAAAARRLLVEIGARVDGRRVRKGERLQSGQLVQIRSPAPPPAASGAASQDEVDLGRAVRGRGAGGDGQTRGGAVSSSARGRDRDAGRGVVARFPECAAAGRDALEAGLAHRLDVGTSGVIWRPAARGLPGAAAAAGGRREQKQYLAEVVGLPTAQKASGARPAARATAWSWTCPSAARGAGARGWCWAAVGARCRPGPRSGFCPRRTRVARRWWRPG